MRNALVNIRDPRWCASWRGAVLLVLLCVAVYVPGLVSLPTVDRDEARFAQASRQMLESVALPESLRDPALHSGGVVVPMVQDRARLNKPPLIYWLQAASAWAVTGGDPFRDAVWMYRIPSVVSALLSVLVVWRIGLSMFDPRAAVLAGAMLAVCPLFVWEARQARADHVLTLCTTASMWALWELWRRGRRWGGTGRAKRGGGRVGGMPRPIGWALLLWIGVGLGVMTKGPITPMVVGLAVCVLGMMTRRWFWIRSTRPLLGAALVVACVAPWVVLLADRYGLASYLALVYDETLGRAGSAREGHVGPPGYHLVLLIVMFWPGSMVTGMAVCRAWGRTVRGLRPWRWRARVAIRSRAAEFFCLAWVLPAWLVFEITATKLPHYPMPLYPALALLSARTLLAVSAGSVPMAWGWLARTVYATWIGVGVVAGVGLLGGSLLLFDASWSGPVGLALPLVIGLVALQVLLMARAVASLVGRRIARAMRAGLSMAVVLWIGTLGIVVPRAPSLWATGAIGRSLRSIDPGGVMPLATLYHEDSLVFETRGRVERVASAEGMRAFFLANPEGLGIVRQRDLAQLPFVEAVALLRGFNVARVARERLAIVRAAAPVPAPDPSSPATERGAAP